METSYFTSFQTWTSGGEGGPAAAEAPAGKILYLRGVRAERYNLLSEEGEIFTLSPKRKGRDSPPEADAPWAQNLRYLNPRGDLWAVRRDLNHNLLSGEGGI